MNRYMMINIWIFLLLSVSLQAQKVFLSNPDISVKEELFMCLDRNVYCVDELVYFRIFNVSAIDIQEIKWSEVVDVEIITPEGRSVGSGKFPFSANGASGAIKLSQNILSGNYYIRAYTKWMRNQSARNYFYEGITILNPYKPEVLTASTLTNEIDKIIADTIKSKNNHSFQISKTQFQTNTPEEITISRYLRDSLLTNVCLSIVKKGTVNESTVDFSAENDQVHETTFIPELRGITISGKVINKIDSLAVPFAKVWVTLQTSKTVMRDVMSDENGSFTIDLGNDYGIRNLFIDASSSKSNVVPMVKIDNDFSFSVLNLPFVPFSIPPEQIDWYRTLSVNSQLNQFYKNNTIINDTTALAIDSTDIFYGTPNFSLKISDYIGLPTIEDYFKELVPMVSIRKEDGKKSFHVMGIYPELLIYDPLIMVDKVRIEDAEEILNIVPSELDRIDVVVNPFLRGDNTYGGVIHFISKNNDFGKIELPEESMFLSYRLLDSIKKEPFDAPVLLPQPFVGNCLYWESSLSFDIDNSLLIHFNTGTEPGTYELKIEGIDTDNKPFGFITDLEIH